LDRSIRDQQRFLHARGDRADRHPVGRVRDAHQEIDPVADDQFLREALGGIGGQAAVVAFNDLDFAAGDRIAVLFHERCDRGVRYFAAGRVAAGERGDPTDLERRLIGAGAVRKERCECKRPRERSRRARTIAHRYSAT